MTATKEELVMAMILKVQFLTGIIWISSCSPTALAREGPLSSWGIKGRIRVADIVQLVGPEANLSIQSI